MCRPTFQTCLNVRVIQNLSSLVMTTMRHLPFWAQAQAPNSFSLRLMILSPIVQISMPRRQTLSPEARLSAWTRFTTQLLYVLQQMQSITRNMAVLSLRPTLRQTALSLFPGVPVMSRAIVNSTLEKVTPSRAPPTVLAAHCDHISPETGKSVLKNYGGAWGHARSCPRCDGRWKQVYEGGRTIWEPWPRTVKPSGPLQARSSASGQPFSAPQSMATPAASSTSQPARNLHQDLSMEHPVSLRRTLGPGEAAMANMEEEDFELA